MKTKMFFIVLFSALSVFSLKINAQSETDIISAMYSGADDVVELSDDLISYVSYGVWTASASGTVTTTGTLTQSATNPDSWSYSALPGDKLVLVFSSGTTMSFKINSISGYTDGSVDDFLDAHQMNFISEITNTLNLSITSNIGYNSDTGKTEWVKTIKGNVLYDGLLYTVNLKNSGNKKGDIGWSYALYDYYEEFTGTTKSQQVSYTINQIYSSHIAEDSNIGKYAQDRQSMNNNLAQTSTDSYHFDDAYCKWLSVTYSEDSLFNVVNEPYNWKASGQLIKNNEVYGTVQFDRTILDGSYGPYLIAKCSKGSNYVLSMLLNPIATGINDAGSVTLNIDLMQNYPNPFSQFTEISYQLKKAGKVILKVYDINGNEVETLVNKEQSSGEYHVRFDALGLPDGCYIYKLICDNSVQVKKMILQKR